MPKISAIATSLDSLAEDDTKRFIYHDVSEFEDCIAKLKAVEGECPSVYTDINSNVALSDHAFVVDGRAYLYEEKLEILARFNNLYGNGYNVINDVITSLSNVVREHNGNEWSRYFELIDKARSALLTELNGYKDAANAARSYTVTTRHDDDDGTTTETKESPLVTFDESSTSPSITVDSSNTNSEYKTNVESLNEKLPDLGKWNKKIEEAQALQSEAATAVAGFTCPWTSYKDASADNAANILTEREYATRKANNPDFAEKYPTYQDYLNDMYNKWGPGGTEKVKVDYGLDEWAPNKPEETENGTETTPETETKTGPESEPPKTEARATAEESYAMNIQTTSASSSYDEARSLQTEIDTEQQLLLAAKTDITGLKASLEANKDNLSQETYEKQMAIYDKKLEKIDEQLAIRSKINNQITEEVRDNFGSDDGPLKDARDWGSNDVATAQSSAQRINDSAAGIESIDSILQDENGEYQVRIYSTYTPEMRSDYGSYGENLGNIPLPRDSYSQSTAALAYESAQSQGKTQELPGGAVAFNASEYVTSGYNDAPGAFMSGTCASGDCNTTQSKYTNTNDDYDTVYYNNHYYSYDEYTNLLSGGGE